ncbi:MAG: RNA methyltransferase, partial [Pseudomonadota bacterium]
MFQPAFILVRPQMGENIGAAARAMWNFGLDHMRIVAPRDGWPNQSAVAMASGAGRLLDEAQLYKDVTSAIGDRTHVYATTARPRELTKTVLTPEAAMADASARIRAGAQIGILFGPERAGLENDDIAPANTIISVPVNPSFPSLNLAQCALILGYEWRKLVSDTEQFSVAESSEDQAKIADIEHLVSHYEERLDEAGFFFPAAKAQSRKTNFRN